jgi:hypothetical protein
MMLAFIITIVACAMVAGLFMSLAYAIIAVLYEWGNDNDLDDEVAEVINKYTVDDEIAAATAALVKPVTPTGETAEIAASLEAQRVHERSKL